MMRKCDVLIIGAGPGGLAAAKGAKEAGAGRVIVLERDCRAGGILNQCIHDGFGLIRYRKHLTGPEYADRAVREALNTGVEILTGHQVIRLTESREVTAVSRDGLKRFQAGAVVVATGCRERTRGAISIPGSRPAGVYTAGVVQNLVNIHNIMPGRRVVILGSGDVGMIMARRLTLEGASVKAVVEILPQPAGLARNVSQCLYDYGIPIHCSHTVSNIIGKKKLTAVEISRVDEQMRPIKGTEQIIECDSLVLSVGLIPENEIAGAVGVELDSRSNGAVTDVFLQTNLPGIFSCGNSRSIMDLADIVSEQGEIAGKNAFAFVNGQKMSSWDDSRSTSMLKGYPTLDSVTCPLCPNGCQVKWDENNETYKGNRCSRGATFAKQERLAPRRMLTTTVKLEGECNELIPVKSDKPISKSMMISVVRELRNVSVKSTVQNGDVVLRFMDGDESIAVIVAGNRR